MRLVIDKHAQRRLLGMPAKTRTAMLERLKPIAADPFAGHRQVKPLRGEQNAFVSATATGVRSTGSIAPRKK
jgi:hypothetical protein